MNELVTVFTPLYNRVHLIRKLYESLLRQTSKDFIWYIINDGSTDGSDAVVQEMILEKSIPIKYEYQKNSGKHVAHNLAAANCSTELFVCVDSDDYLTDDAIEVIKRIWGETDDAQKPYLSGIVANCAFSNGEIIGTPFPDGITCESLSQLYRLGKKGDTTLIFQTGVLKKYPFPVFEGERFLREHIIYDEIDKNYKLRVTNKALCVCEYFEDGLSKNAPLLELKNPKGAALARLHDYKKEQSRLTKIRLLAAYVLFSIIAKDFKGAVSEIGLLKAVILTPVAAFGYIRYIIIKGK